MTRWRNALARASARALAGALLLLAAAAPAALGQGGAQPSVVLAPHRAVYEIATVRASGGAGVTDMVGRMVYEITGSACAGYTQTMRFVTRTTNHDGKVSTSDLRSTSTEDVAATRLTFSSAQYRDGKRSEQTAGTADRADGSVSIELTQPRRKQLKLDGATMFPIQHSIQLLEKARAGTGSYEVDLYDGSDKGEKVYATVSLIGKRMSEANKALPKVAGTDRLDGLAAWPMTVSYYTVKSKADAAPSYELSFLFFDNGVSRRLRIDYGDFAIRGTLKSIDFLEPTPCAGSAAPKSEKK